MVLSSYCHQYNTYPVEKQHFQDEILEAYINSFFTENEQKNLSKQRILSGSVSINNKIHSKDELSFNQQYRPEAIRKTKTIILSLLRIFALFIIILGLLIHYYDLHKISKFLHFKDQQKLPRIARSTFLSLQKQEQQQKINVQWPLDTLPYHIYPKANTRIVLDVAKQLFGEDHLTLYDWEDHKSQQFYFKKVKENFYHIINAKSGYFMRKSDRKRSTQNMISFSSQKGPLWQIISAENTAPNAFYILSSDNQSLTVMYEHADKDQDLVLEDFHKKQNQLWFFRKNIQYLTGFQSNQQQYEKQLSTSLSKVMEKSPIVETNQVITIKEMKHEMARKELLMMPQWLAKPKVRNYSVEGLVIQNGMNQSSLELQSPKSKSVGYLLNRMLKFIDFISSFFQFKPNKIVMQCASNHTVAYIWYGKKEMPFEYKELLKKCENNTVLLTEEDFELYVRKWNEIDPLYSINIDDYPIRQRINLLKLLYLYFQSGIYADFDTEITESCFSNIYSDQIIFTNRMDEDLSYDMEFQVEQIVIPEQNFMMVRNKFNLQVKRMLQQEIMERNYRGGQRWRECAYRQCLIVQCQRHFRDNTYKRGFN